MGKIKKGYILKSDFCKKYNIKISEFNKVMIEKNYLVKNVYHTFNGENYIKEKEKIKIGVNVNNKEVDNNIDKISGTWSQGTFQYKEKFLLNVFNLKEITEESFYGFKLNFGKYSGRKICNMKTEGEKDYILWLHKQMKSNNRTDTKIYKALEWYIKLIKPL